MFIQPVIDHLAKAGTPYVGVLYAGLMLTADGPVLLECNARFGDPETQAVLPRLAVALGPLLLAAARGDLARASQALGLADSRLPVFSGATVAVVLASAGYPDAPRRGDAIEGLDDAVATGALAFHAGTAIDADGTVRTAGGRVLAVVGRGPDLAAARDQAERAAEAVRWDGLQRRHDIGATDAAVAISLAGAAR